MATDMEMTIQTVLNGQADGLDFERPNSLVNQIYKTLGRAIANGSIAPGQVLKETELQQHFDVSRAPIREAIRLLEADRLVVAGAYKKKHVRLIMYNDLLEVIPVLACIEGCAARLAVLQINSDETKAFEEINDEMKKAYLAGDLDQCNDLNFKFHKLYVKASANETLIQALRPIIRRVVRLWVSTLYRQRPSLFEYTIGEHDKIIDAIRNRDARKAEDMVKKHIENVLDRALKASVFDEEGNFKIS